MHQQSCRRVSLSERAAHLPKPARVRTPSAANWEGKSHAMLVLNRRLFGLPVRRSDERLKAHPTDDLFERRVVAACRHKKGARNRGKTTGTGIWYAVGAGDARSGA